MSDLSRAEAAYMRPPDEIDVQPCTCGHALDDHTDLMDRLDCIECGCRDFRESEPYTRDDWEADEADRIIAERKCGDY